MAKKLLIAADVDASLRERAARDGRFEILDHPVRTEDELAAVVGECEILVTRSYNRVTKRVIDHAPRLELIAQGTSGTDNIDSDTARERGIAIVSLPGENANAVAELVIGFMIALTRTVPGSTRELAAGIWNRYDCSTRHELRHFLLGIVGLGQVGSRVAKLSKAFGMDVQAYDPYLSEKDFEDRGAIRVDSLEALLRSSDIVTLHVPLTWETRRMVHRENIAVVRRGTFLINAARGEVLEQAAALEALASNHLGGLALDVFDPEPPAHGFPDDPRLILTPHIGGCTNEAKAAIGAKLYEKICAFYDR
jgi:D-3-phosphoglycerate dehydrogenase / 2-oxoglutarate reductase